jgi:hypothetical protein
LGIPHGYGNPHLHQLLDIYEIMNIYQSYGYDSLSILGGGLEHFLFSPIVGMMIHSDYIF